MIVTVQETIEHNRDITAEMVEAYLMRRGWSVESTSERYVWYTREDSPMVAVPRNGAMWHVPLRAIIETLGDYVNRKPHEVLADIAEGR